MKAIAILTVIFISLLSSMGFYSYRSNQAVATKNEELSQEVERLNNQVREQQEKISKQEEIVSTQSGEIEDIKNTSENASNSLSEEQVADIAYCETNKAKYTKEKYDDIMKRPDEAKEKCEEAKKKLKKMNVSGADCDDTYEEEKDYADSYATEYKAYLQKCGS